MPLIKSKSKKAFGENVAKEMEAGKPQKQSLAIAFNTQRHAMGKKMPKKMAMGGAVESPDYSKHPYSRNPGTPAAKPDDTKIPESEFMSKNWSEGSAPPRKPDDRRLPEAEYMSNRFARGGMIPAGSEDTQEPGVPSRKPDDSRPPEDQYMSSRFDASDQDAIESIVEAVISRRRAKMMAEGGMVDIQENGEESGQAPYDRMNADAYKKELYDDSQWGPQPEDSNEKGDDIDNDAHDMISQIRAKMKAKRGA